MLLKVSIDRQLYFQIPWNLVDFAIAITAVIDVKVAPHEVFHVRCAMGGGARFLSR